MSNNVLTTPAPASPTKNIPALIPQILRGVQFVFAIIVIGTVGAVISSNSDITGCAYDGAGDYLCFWTPARFNYAIFASVWTILVSIYFIASTFVPKISIIVVALVLDFLSIIIWFAAWVSIAVWLGALGHWYGNGVATHNGEALLQAATVFGAFLWLSYIATFALTFLSFFRNRKAHQDTLPMQQPSKQKYVPA